ncbi:MAG: cell division protein ZapA [Oscillospiraceae bacterium]|nr:cell division protein ZapA [Oscillospiraceae bacterium]MDD6528049.1 cell division protein ZapA [Oscillospiraceae bacterium]
MDRNKVKLNIGGAEYSILTDDDASYAIALGKEVDLALDKIMKENPRLSMTQAAVMLALSYADEYKKTSTSAEHLREQIKDYLDDASDAKSKADWARREAEKAKRDLEDSKLEVERLRAQLSSVLDQIGKKK